MLPKQYLVDFTDVAQYVKTMLIDARAELVPQDRFDIESYLKILKVEPFIEKVLDQIVYNSDDENFSSCKEELLVFGVKLHHIEFIISETINRCIEKLSQYFPTFTVGESNQILFDFCNGYDLMITFTDY